MNEVSMFRLHLMRAMYALMAFAMGSGIWRALLNHAPWDRWHSVGVAMLAALAAVSALGIRYPVKMLPILLFELAWKTIFVVLIAFPLWRSGQLDPATRETAVECLIGVVLVPLVIPWRHVWTHFARNPGDPWRRPPRAAPLPRG